MTGRVVEPEQCGTTACFHSIFVFDAHSGPSGENPTGTVRNDIESELGNFTFDTARVTCLNVNGNRATVGTDFTVGIRVLFSLEDNDGAGQDRSGFSPTFQFLSDCPANPGIALAPIFGGDITIHDAPPFPTSKDQCKGDGWRNFVAFKSQGACISFVATGGKNPPNS